MPSWNDIWSQEFLDNSVAAWTLAFVAFLLTFTVLPLVRGFIAARRGKWLHKASKSMFKVTLKDWEDWRRGWMKMQKKER